jgi:hypothetical protein
LWQVIFEDSKPADLNDRICIIGFVRVAGQKPILDVLYNDAAEVGCSESSLSRVLLKLSDSERLAEMQIAFSDADW